MLETIGTDLLFLIKIGVLILLGLYCVFAFVVFIQVRTMNNIIKQSVSSIGLLLLSILHVLAAISLFLLALAIL